MSGWRGAPARTEATAAPVAAGAVVATTFESPTLRNTRALQIYTPPGFTLAPGDYPLLVVLDSGAYGDYVPVPAILDALIAQKRIAPLVAVMVGNVSRTEELQCSPAYASFLARELVPWMRERYRAGAAPASTVVSGASLGGLAASFAAFQHPDVFGNVVSQSGSYWWTPAQDAAPEWLTRRFAAESPKAVRVSMSVGAMEIPEQLETNRRFRDALAAQGLRRQLLGVQREPQLSQLESRPGPSPRASDRAAAIAGRTQIWPGAAGYRISDMRKTLVAIGIAAAALTPLAALAQTAPAPSAGASSKKWTTPRTPWGEPDLQGTYSNRTITPFERPATVGGREFFTAEEAAALEKRAQEQSGDEGRSKGTRGDVERAYNDFWWDRGTKVTSLRTSLVVDLPDGKVPRADRRGAKARRRRAEASGLSWRRRFRAWRRHLAGSQHVRALHHPRPARSDEPNGLQQQLPHHPGARLRRDPD